MGNSTIKDGRRFVSWGNGLPGDNAFAVAVPSGITRQDELYHHLGQGLEFPDYFGGNRDAFDECLNDLSWLEQEQIVIYHHDVPFPKGSEDRRIYLEILKDACAADKWRDPLLPSKDIWALFPESCLSELESH